MNSKPVITPGPRATTTLVARGLATPGDLRGGRAAESAALTRRHDILMTVKLKGRASAAQVADAVGFDASTLLDALAHDGLVEPVRSSFRITPAGAETVGRALEAIGAEIGDSELERSYARFCPTNDAFKQTVTDWQLRTVDGVHTLNDHSDEGYDAAVLDRLGLVHDDISALLERFSHAASRYGRYRDRLTSALAMLTSGRREYMASPAVDSYHSVWFELHEELIMLCGLTRAGEAEAGRG
jgi:pyruvate,orthophosphate dikinase